MTIEISQCHEGDYNNKATVNISITTAYAFDIVTMPSEDKTDKDEYGQEHDKLEFEKLVLNVYPSDFLEYCTDDEITKHLFENDFFNGLDDTERAPILKALEAVEEDRHTAFIDDILSLLKSGDTHLAIDEIERYIDSPYTYRTHEEWQAEYNKAMNREAA